jgi:hypothetical protein
MQRHPVAALQGHGRCNVASHDAVPGLYTAAPGPDQRPFIKRPDRQQWLHMADARLAEAHVLQQLLCIFGQIGAFRVAVTHLAGICRRSRYLLY